MDELVVVDARLGANRALQRVLATLRNSARIKSHVDPKHASEVPHLAAASSGRLAILADRDFVVAQLVAQDQIALLRINLWKACQFVHLPEWLRTCGLEQ